MPPDRGVQASVPRTAHEPRDHAGLVEWGVRVTRAESLRFLPFGLAGRARIEGGLGGLSLVGETK